MDCEILISEVFTRKPLWDISHHQHHNRGVLDKLWSEISSIMKFPVKEIRQKWKYLRDQYRKELKKVPRVASGGEGGPSYEPTWPYFQLLLFLKEQMTPHAMTGNISYCSSESTPTQKVLQVSQDYDESSEDENEQLNEPLQQSAAAQKQSTTPSTHRQDKRSTRSGITTSTMNAKLLKLEERKLELLSKECSSNEENKSDDYHFLMSLLPMLKKFTDFQKLKIRTQIQQLIMDEMNTTLTRSLGSTPGPGSYDVSRSTPEEYECGTSYTNPTFVPLSQALQSNHQSYYNMYM